MIRSMTDNSRPQPLPATVGDRANRHHAKAIEWLAEENRTLKEQLEGKQPRLTDDHRHRLAAKGKPPTQRPLDKVARIVTPDKS